MDISLLNAGLAAGAAAAAVPFVLHLIMKQKPKHIIFPALQLIRERQKRSRKKLKVKNWLLLLARMALFALMALALARPTLYTEVPLGDQEVDTAMAFVIDTSLSMQYTDRGVDRLKEAKTRAAEILKKATDRSEIFVIDSAEPSRPLPISPTLALKRIDALTLRAANRPLNSSLVQAYAAVGASKLPRREVYVLSDLAQSGWDLASTKVVEELNKLEATKIKINTFLLRLTPKDVKNVAVISAEPSSTIAAQGDSLEIRAKIRSFGQKASRVAKLEIDGEARGQSPLELPENGDVEAVFFTPSTLALGLHQGVVRLTGGSDFMEFDDVRYFSFSIQPASRILLVAPTEVDALFVKNALAPEASAALGGAPQLYKVERVVPSEFPSRAAAGLKPFTAIFLLNVDQLPDAAWSLLNTYVRDGGGLVIGLGDRVKADSYNSEIASQLLPAKLLSISPKTTGGTFGRFDAAHPLFNRFAKSLDGELAKVPIYRYWLLEPQGGRACLWFSDNKPALVERTFSGSKTGHVLLWASPLSRRPEINSPAAWNEFPTSWSFLSLMLETASYLSGSASQQLNYEAGQDALIALDPAKTASSYNVTSPESNASERLSAPTNSSTLVIPTPQGLGNWQVSGKTAENVDLKYGFSVNPPAAESIVVPLADKDFVGIFGKEDNFRLADDAAGLKREQGDVRNGFEIFPWIMMFILLLVTAENLLANRFHRETTPA